MKGLIGKKVGMTQVYDEKGILIPVTVIEAGPCVVVGVKTMERDGYSAVQVGFGVKKVKNTAKPVLGNVKKAGLENNPPAFIREFRSEEDPQAEIGSQIKADIFAEGEYLDISGTTKGKTYLLVRDLLERFRAQNGSTVCRELKGIGTDAGMLRTCEGCIEDAVGLACAIIDQRRGA